jgi:hypothetical protein
MDFINQTKQVVALQAHGGDSPAAKAARDTIKSFDDLGRFDDVKAALSQLTDDRERDGVYWMLESLARNTGSTQAAEFLMEQVGREAKKTAKAAILERIGALKRRGIRIGDASNALACLAEKMRHLRTAAITALGCCADPRAEAALIDLIQEQLTNPAESGWYLYGAVESLSQIATAKALACMLEVIAKIGSLPIDTRKGDIEALAVKTVGKVGGAKHVDLFCALLSANKAPVVKWHAMRALGRHARKRHLPAIEQRVRAILSSKRVIPQTEPPFIAPKVGDILFSLTEGVDVRTTELRMALEILARLKAFKDRKIVQYLREKWPALTADEKAFLTGTTGDFAGVLTRQSPGASGARSRR